MTRTAVSVGVALVLCTAVAAVTQAHHSISAAYDDSKRVTIDAVVGEFHFVNPHPYVIAEVTTDGRLTAWKLDMDNRGELAAVGVTTMTFRNGDRVVVSGSPSRTTPNNLYVRRLERRADGFVYEQVGSSPRITGGRR